MHIYSFYANNAKDSFLFNICNQKMWVRVLKVLATAVCIVIINAAAYIVDKGVLTVHHSGDTVHARMLENVSVRLNQARRFNMMRKQP